MVSIALALALFLQGQPAAAAEAPPEPPMPAGAPKDDYLFVGWCYGVLRGYLDLHDQVMPEVTRIETAFRPPDRKLSDDLQVYADMQKEGQKQLKTFQAALTAAEKASLKPINVMGAKAVSDGAEVWHAGADVTPARLAQEWMSWALPARCEVTAKALKANATLMGGAFKVNAQPDPPPPPPEAEKQAEKAAEPAGDAKPADAAPAAETPAAEAPAPADPAAVLLGAAPDQAATDPAADPAPAAKPKAKPKKKPAH